MMLRSFTCQPTLQGACTPAEPALLLLLLAAAAASMSTSPWSGLKMCSSVAFCDRPSLELYGYAGVLLLLAAAAVSTRGRRATPGRGCWWHQQLGFLTQRQQGNSSVSVNVSGRWPPPVKHPGATHIPCCYARVLLQQMRQHPGVLLCCK